MKKHKYFTKNIDNQWEVVSEEVANDVIRQYIERRYIGVIIGTSFLIGFLLGIIANAK